MVAVTAGPISETETARAALHAVRDICRLNEDTDPIPLGQALLQVIRPVCPHNPALSGQILFNPDLRCDRNSGLLACMLRHSSFPAIGFEIASGSLPLSKVSRIPRGFYE